jgi:hypothetical protein
MLLGKASQPLAIGRMNNAEFVGKKSRLSRTGQSCSEANRGGRREEEGRALHLQKLHTFLSSPLIGGVHA